MALNIKSVGQAQAVRLCDSYRRRRVYRPAKQRAAGDMRNRTRDALLSRSGAALGGLP